MWTPIKKFLIKFLKKTCEHWPFLPVFFNTVSFFKEIHWSMRSIISSNLLVISFGVQTIGFMRIKVNWTIFEVPEKTNRTVGYIKAKKWVSFKLNGGVWVCTLATVCTNSTGSWKGSDVLKPFQLPYADKVGKTIKRCIVQLSFARLFP